MNVFKFKKEETCKVSPSPCLPSLDCVQEHKIGSGFYGLPKTPDSPYVVDDSCFIPMSEAVKQLGLNLNWQGADNKSMYDFPDGRDSGIEIPINRTKNGKDIAEISSEIAEQQEHIASELKKEKDFQDYTKQVQERIAESKSKSLPES